MRIGLNFTNPVHFADTRRLLQEGRCDFIELLVDNFLHLDAEAIRQELDGFPVAFHIMSSRFLEAPEADLVVLARRLRDFHRALRPLYVSDHLARFTHEGRRLPAVVELDYAAAEHVVGRIHRWQEMLEAPLLLENFASMGPWGKPQPEFVQALGVDVLFDVSNAQVAEANDAAPFSSWAPVLARTTHFHAAGFRVQGTPPRTFDTHDSDLAAPTLEVLTGLRSRADATLVLERDANWSYAAVAAELQAVAA